MPEKFIELLTEEEEEKNRKEIAIKYLFYSVLFLNMILLHTCLLERITQYCILT